MKCLWQLSSQTPSNILWKSVNSFEDDTYGWLEINDLHIMYSFHVLCKRTHTHPVAGGLTPKWTIWGKWRHEHAKPSRVPLSTPPPQSCTVLILHRVIARNANSSSHFMSFLLFSFTLRFPNIRLLPPCPRPAVCWTSVHNGAGWWITPGFPNSKQAWGHGASYLLVPLGAR
jgi:hypothetical protein